MNQATVQRQGRLARLRQLALHQVPLSDIAVLLDSLSDKSGLGTTFFDRHDCRRPNDQSAVRYQGPRASTVHVTGRSVATRRHRSDRGWHAPPPRVTELASSLRSPQ
jgi:hypothetical protein